MDKEVAVLIGGESGQGIDFAGRILGEFFNEQGLYCFSSREYESVIKGGHTYSIVRASEKEVLCSKIKLDYIIALNEDCLRHLKNLKTNGKIICDKGLKIEKSRGITAIRIPFDEIVEKFGKIFLNSACISAMLCVSNYDMNEFMKLIKKEKEQNQKVVNFIFNYIKKNYSKIIERKKEKSVRKGEMLSGNEAIALGMKTAGLERYYAYPMTPATTILHYLAKKQREFNMLALQLENEISVINCALGSAYAGKKTAVGTSGGGFDLMHEALSLAGMAEIPILVINVQRGGPSTGIPTHTSQADLLSVVYSSHGEFPRIVLAPSTTEEAYEKSAEALNLAWKFQIPVILLSDKSLSEESKTTSLKKIENLKINFEKGSKKYMFSKNGISPLIIPGTDTIVKSNSYEHDEEGYTTEDPEMAAKMQEKRAKKREYLIEEMKKLETVKKYGNSDNIIISWGFSASELREAVKNVRKPVKIIQPIYIEPFPVWEIENELKKAKKVIIVEKNHDAQLAKIIRENTGFSIENKILKYDGTVFDPDELAEKINGMLK